MNSEEYKKLIMLRGEYMEYEYNSVKKVGKFFAVTNDDMVYTPTICSLVCSIFSVSPRYKDNTDHRVHLLDSSLTTSYISADYDGWLSSVQLSFRVER